MGVLWKTFVTDPSEASPFDKRFGSAQDHDGLEKSVTATWGRYPVRLALPPFIGQKGASAGGRSTLWACFVFMDPLSLRAQPLANATFWRESQKQHIIRKSRRAMKVKAWLCQIQPMET
mmetsp:Transcript_94344/g.237870  ORF Transcript_94344/g.237870 Transcript_94344/m.237870 type:complete len:119 (+) Transcript_94344:1134-1490(+)